MYNKVTESLNTTYDIANPELTQELQDDTTCEEGQEEYGTQKEYAHHDGFQQQYQEKNGTGHEVQDEDGTRDKDTTPQDKEAHETNPPKQKYQRLVTPEARQQRDAVEHIILPPCQWHKEGLKAKCSKDCSSKFTLDERKAIHAEFWNLAYNERTSWLGRVVQTKLVASKTSKFYQTIAIKTGYKGVYFIFRQL